MSYLDLPEGDYTLTLAASAAAFRDVRGNLLDGNGDGTEGDPFTVAFQVDVTSLSYPTPLELVPPPASLIYQAPVTGRFHAVGDVDTFTLEIDAGQTISLRLTAQDSTIVGHIEILGPESESLATVTAPVPGATALLQTLPVVTSGLYTIRLSSQAGTGGYDAQVLLNTAFEAETFTGTSNDTLTDAQDLTASAVALQGPADRLAVVGHKDLGEDLYRVALTAGQAATVVLTGAESNEHITLELLDSSGNPLALGAENATETGQAIRGFVAPSAGTYYLKVSGVSNQDYSLVVTRQADFESEPNAPEGQDIGLTGQVLGALPGDIRVAVLGRKDFSFRMAEFLALVDQLRFVGGA